MPLGGSPKQCVIFSVWFSGGVSWVSTKVFFFLERSVFSLVRRGGQVAFLFLFLLRGRGHFFGLLFWVGHLVNG